MSKVVLIVEDNELNMKLINDLLILYGYTTVKAKDGVTALQLSDFHRPNLIITDIQLPLMSGLELIRALKKDTSLADIPIIAVTAFAMKGDEKLLRESGCDAYLSKPFSVAKFLEIVQNYVKT